MDGFRVDRLRRTSITQRSLEVLWAISLTMFGAQAFAQEKEVYLTPEAAKANSDFALQGEYTGAGFGLQVVALGGGEFRTVHYPGGLPGAGWTGQGRQENDENAASIREFIASRKLKKAERKSPTLGAKPPPGAVVLFDGSEASLKQWQPGARIEDGLLVQGATSVPKFTDFILHIEFRLPYMPKARGQARGNSGIYYQGRYETQMLDSFGLEGKDNECGGIYSIKPPDVNMCFPPLSWQTYDVQFTAAKWDKDGKKTADAKVTVKHNGVTIHQDVSLPHATTAAPLPVGPEPGPIYLQDHGNPVRYRNIWVVPIEAKEEAKRPRVLGFERFHAGAGSDLLEGGRLLLTELHCTACHHDDTGAIARESRPPPVLTEVGSRIHPEYIERFLLSPFEVKPGTTMPDVLGGLEADERKGAAGALTHLLASTGVVIDRRVEGEAAERGKHLFGEIGCFACHTSANDAAPATLSLPLENLQEKYSVASLAAFLHNPLSVRKGGRMPQLVHDEREALDLASFLIGPRRYRPRNPNLSFAVYFGNWQNVPDFSALKPEQAGLCRGFDIGVAERPTFFGVRFEGLVYLEREGSYTFHLGSDDGSVLLVDGKRILDVDGQHPHTERSANVQLTTGRHEIVVDYIQGIGDASLKVEIEGPELSRRDLASIVRLPENVSRPAADDDAGGFAVDLSRVAEGKRWFAKLGCANCHELKLGGEALVSGLQATPLKDLKTDRGCLARSEERGPAPDFRLGAYQRQALAAALVSADLHLVPTQEKLIGRTMASFNCYACHSRRGTGGPPRELNHRFRTTIQEMGDEGRLPPPLDGVGDKLTSEYLRYCLERGPKDRPYMLTRMPRFPFDRLEHLVSAFASSDRRQSDARFELAEPEHRAKAKGLILVDNNGLGCIKCHMYGRNRIDGIQAVNLLNMTHRIREDWFMRYMRDPQAFRPGTRMPSSFPDGKSVLASVFDGDPDKQLSAIWALLKDGDKAATPDGLVHNAIELAPTDRPILYRGFLDGLSPRGIAVGFPEKAHFAWDLDRMCLALVWRGRFIDASMHWQDRGSGFQRPMGHHVLRVEEGGPVARLESRSAPWPAQAPRERGDRFLGYSLDEAGRPTFRYRAAGAIVEDRPVPVSKGEEAGFQREVSIRAEQPANLYFRAAVADKIGTAAGGFFVVNEALRLRFDGGEAFIRESAGRKELILPLVFAQGSAKFVEVIEW